MRLTTNDGRSVGRATRSPLWAAALVVGALLLDFCRGPSHRRYACAASVLSADHPGGSQIQNARRADLSAFGDSALPRRESHLFTLNDEEPDLVQITLFLAVGMITAKMTRDADHLRRLAMTDDLTGLHNLRSFEARLITMVREATTEPRDACGARARSGSPEIAERPIRTSDRCRSRSNGRSHYW